MSDKKFCHFWNVGFCKFHGKCYLEHAQGDCKNNQCYRKSCHQRHRKQCNLVKSAYIYQKAIMSVLTCQGNTNQQKYVTKLIVDINFMKE